jgi:hypothetical protein
MEFAHGGASETSGRRTLVMDHNGSIETEDCWESKQGRSMQVGSADLAHLSRRNVGERSLQCWNEGDQILEFVGACTQDYNGDIASGEFILPWQVAIAGDQDVPISFDRGYDLTVLQSTEAEIAGGDDFVP